MSALLFRLAKLEDADVLLQWRNDLQTRVSSRNMDIVKIDGHRKWLAAVLQDSKRHLYVVECEGVLVGTVRIDEQNGMSELSWTVAPEHRGKGLGKRMVLKLASSVERPIYAEVKKGNVASEKIALHAGMRFLSCDSSGMLRFHREAKYNAEEVDPWR